MTIQKENQDEQARRKTKPVIVLMPPPMLAELEAEAQRLTVSRSAVVREACRHFLKRRDDK